MKEAKIKKKLDNTYHRDGTVSYWDCLTQQWVRECAEMISDQVLATMTDAERERIARMAGRSSQLCSQ